ncbi:hypothetical protein pipiens_017226 [Culex pipiens pipiens]|uniref:Uncharacterized protein n=1 Tax=Culex pipiens pipiens TaxID=38569 RepID=A0ABD1CHL0_CULPP
MNKRSILERDMAYDDWRRAPPDRKTLAHLRYKTLRNKTNTLIDKAKSQYTTRFLDSTIPTKTLWKRVRSVGAAKDKTPAVCCFHPDDVNQAFLSSFIAKDNPRPSRAAATFRFSFRPVQHWEVVNAICDIRSNATGVDGLPICFIKIILPLSRLSSTWFRTPSSSSLSNWSCSSLNPRASHLRRLQSGPTATTTVVIYCQEPVPTRNKFLRTWTGNGRWLKQQPPVGTGASQLRE